MGGWQTESYVYREKEFSTIKIRILASPSSPLTQLLLAEHHDTPMGGHSGYEKTL